jgi:hypothetical protein
MTTLSLIDLIQENNYDEAMYSIFSSFIENRKQCQNNSTAPLERKKIQLLCRGDLQ